MGSLTCTDDEFIWSLEICLYSSLELSIIVSLISNSVLFKNFDLSHIVQCKMFSDLKINYGINKLFWLK